jgi:hypothetical protein
VFNLKAGPNICNREVVMKRCALLILVITFLFWPWVSKAETPKNPSRFQVCATVAPIGYGGPLSPTASRATISLGKSGHWITLGGSWIRGDDHTWAIMGPKEPRYNSFRDVELLYGRRLVQGASGYVLVSAGIARALYKSNGTERRYVGSFPPDWHPEYAWVPKEELRHTMWGVPVAIQAVAAAGGFGVGIELFADFNGTENFGGVLFCLHFGS